MPRRAFTLVELLVVIAIIGLLSSVAVVGMNSARVASRDAKRKADLYQISQAIELYNDINGSLPRVTTWCTYISNPTNNWGPDFQADLAPYLAKVPLDPIAAGQTGDYIFYNTDDVSKYRLCANLEKPTGISYTVCGSLTRNYCLIPNGL
jgi:prepilin-type N-terminal cleavage/methylation domain-containing protein